MIFKNPNTQEWEDATTYLSGNVRAKLSEAIKKNEQNTEFDQNIAALQKIIPKDLSADEIHVTLGALWVPNAIYQDFANHLMGDKASFTVAYFSDRWNVKEGGSGYYAISVNEWGTMKRPFAALLENVMNGSPITIKYTDDSGKSCVDIEATTEANAKADEIKQEFSDWIWNEASRRIELCKIYNQTYNTFVAPDFANLSRNLTLEGCSMSPYDHQKKAIMRGVLTNNCLLDCCVGSGKTLIIQGIISKLKQMNGSSERIMLVTLNSLVAQFSNAMSTTFPSANVITLESSLSPKKREEILNSALVTDFDVLIVPESTFGAIEAPKDMTITLLEKELADLRESLEECEDKDFNTKRIEKRIENKESELEEIINKPSLTSVTWEDLNITTLIVDEISCFKNLPFCTTHSNVRGMGTPQGSKKAFDFYVKARDIQRRNGRVIGSTGTSLSNSITEAVTWIKVFAPELAYTGLHRVDAFINQFSNPITEYSLSATGRTLKSTTTLKEFQNLTELLTLYRSFAEVLSHEQLQTCLPQLPDGRPAIPPLKHGKVQNVILPISDAQDAVFEQIVQDAMHLDNRDNNMLKLLDRARKASLDIRFLHPDAENENNIVNAVCENVMAIHAKHRHFKGNQIIFADRGCPVRHKSNEIKYWRSVFDRAELGDVQAQNEIDSMGSKETIEAFLGNSFSLYDEITQKLTEKGLKVAVIHDFKTDAKKIKLQSEFNAGNIDILIGSTQKLGIGFNLNSRLTAIHHADLCLRPGDMKQREGRLLRQGNESYISGLLKEVEIFTYSTERTLDSWLASTLDRKATFMAKFNNGTLDTREYHSDSDIIDFGTLSAVISGDNRLIELVKSQQELKRLSVLKRSYQRKMFRLQDDKIFYQNQLNHSEANMAAYIADQAIARQCQTEDIYHSNAPISADIKPFDSKVKNLIQRL